MAQGWRITGQRGSDEPINGRFQRVMVIGVQTDDGTTTEFRVPEAQYTPTAVAALIEDWYERQQAIANL